MTLKHFFLFACFVLLVGCGHKKPPLAPTQTVNGKSIIVPPDFDVVPEIKKETQK
ncbi:MAG: hypothetical protein ACI4OR_03335 [Alphaproteobacteria bacterium]